mgnify:CR=1 FL=1
MNSAYHPSISLDGLKPDQLILARSEAFRRADFALVYDTFHCESTLRLQFTDRDEYADYARNNLQASFNILECRILDHDHREDEARVISLMTVEADGKVLQYAELAWLRKDKGCWRYHRGQRWDENLPVQVEKVSFAAFDCLEPKLIF